MTTGIDLDPSGALGRLRRHHPDLIARIDPDRARAWYASLRDTERLAGDDFGEMPQGGRGESYLRAQAQILMARSTGIATLLDHLTAGAEPGTKVVLDVLGGDGLVRRVATALGRTDLNILTCDVSPYMVQAAWDAGMPALLQRADRLLARDDSVDGVLIAYGAHHIDPEDRVNVVRDAYRVLRPGGTLVLHDFLVGSAMDTWFSEFVDPNSLTGHRFAHFTREEILGYLAKAGFESYEVADMPDPYVAVADTADAAELSLGRYLLDMYGLVSIAHAFGDQADRVVIERARRIFQEPMTPGLRVQPQPDGQWRCTVPRTAVIGIGRKLR
ncbi:class I SAM-dependent methyltransferase [Mangrovihabitans endophyticus]|uniref:SAM-dependent methyltransferase n=1 Tax=Mangrovihabitans endophyticus TaxID=1751298 RepID=A0A8J3BTF0_9ACTN|nr:class I SAM-dependent methyltransferase [Mangrovihabitans endophyticus]GGK72913.1 SAM-dependent methyltransferase [Mangrovihabitans endophyticus]